MEQAIARSSQHSAAPACWGREIRIKSPGQQIAVSLWPLELQGQLLAQFQLVPTRLKTTPEIYNFHIHIAIITHSLHIHYIFVAYALHIFITILKIILYTVILYIVRFSSIFYTHLEAWCNANRSRTKNGVLRRLSQGCLSHLKCWVLKVKVREGCRSSFTILRLLICENKVLGKGWERCFIQPQQIPCQHKSAHFAHGSPGRNGGAGCTKLHYAALHLPYSSFPKISM